MPVVDKNVPASTNGDLIRESSEGSDQRKPLAGVSVLPLEPANQVFQIVFLFDLLLPSVTDDRNKTDSGMVFRCVTFWTCWEKPVRLSRKAA